jgi:hypothetical protein
MHKVKRAATTAAAQSHSVAGSSPDSITSDIPLGRPLSEVRDGLRRRQSGRLQPIRVENAAKGLLRACAKLPVADRQRFVDVLLKHAFLLGGTAPYVAWGTWNLPQRRTAYLRLTEVSMGLADTWYEWAWTLSTEEPFCRPEESVLSLIRELTVQNFMLDPFE